jgi:dihydrofolate reductase
VKVSFARWIESTPRSCSRGGGSIASAFMKAGLIDVYRVTVYPVVLGEGKPLFQGPMNRTGLSLESEKAFASGAVGLWYRKAEHSPGR